jgi:hypothetical protein
VRLTHGSMTAHLDQADAGGVRGATRRTRGGASRDAASHSTTYYEGKRRDDDGDLDVPEFVPRG